MFRQGDREKALAQPVSPLMDRVKGGVTKSQTGFFNIVALPMYTVRVKELWCFLPNISEYSRIYLPGALMMLVFHPCPHSGVRTGFPFILGNAEQPQTQPRPLVSRGGRTPAVIRARREALI